MLNKGVVKHKGTFLKFTQCSLCLRLKWHTVNTNTGDWNFSLGKMTLCKGVILLFLGLFCKVSVAVNSTQVYFFELEIESSVNDEVKKLPASLSQINLNDAVISNITTTTDCVLDDVTKNCSCVSSNTWSSDACGNYKCCKNEKCTLRVTDDAMCLPNKVTINGSTAIEGYQYNQLYDMNNQQTKDYSSICENITKELQRSFSTLPWFTSLVITAFRRGSVIVDYTVEVFGPVMVNQLEGITRELKRTTLITQGLVTIIVPQEQPVDMNSNARIKCTTYEDLGNVKWMLTDAQNKMAVITNGTEASLSRDSFTDIINLQNISGSWKGLFTCIYTKESITYTASDTLDIALLPNIRAERNPQFPACSNTTNTKHVEVQCAIVNNTENYTVTWDSSSHKDLTIKASESKGKMIYYKVDAWINCAHNEKSVSVTCTFTNNRSKAKKYKEMTVEIPIITQNDEFCVSEGNWPQTKSNYTAVLDCDIYAVGENTRTCVGREWQKDISRCVNLGLQEIHNEIEKMMTGQGYIRENADSLFMLLKIQTTDQTINSCANIETSVDILKNMNQLSLRQSHQWNDTIMANLVASISNILNNTQSWNEMHNADSLSVRYLQTVEAMINNSDLPTANHISENVQLKTCNSSDCKFFNARVNTEQNVTVVAFRSLADILPKELKNEEVVSETIVLSVTPANSTNHTNVEMRFDYGKQRHRDHKMFCVYWDESLKEWSQEGCTWGNVADPTLCSCTHNSAFTIMMSKHPETLPYMETLTYIGLGISICSLVLCVLTEFLVWDTVVKSNIANFRHIALVNISICLLFSYCSFLASAKPENISENWCLVLTVVKHFCFLCVFFWMLCLSFVLLHQLIFVFDQLRKKVYFTLSILLGYVCPIVCVTATFIQFSNGKVGEYYSRKTCWLIYKSPLKGSIFAFIFPVGTIVFINMFALFVVITKIVTPAVSESKARDEKDVARGIIKTIVFLSPILGITWLLGLFVFIIDLTQKPVAQIVNYAFTILNSLQGFFILLTNCVGEKKVREALLKRFRAKPSGHSKYEHSTKVTSGGKKK